MYCPANRNRSQQHQNHNQNKRSAKAIRIIALASNIIRKVQLFKCSEKAHNRILDAHSLHRLGRNIMTVIQMFNHNLKDKSQFQ